jgi:hypothetical protein
VKSGAWAAVGIACAAAVAPDRTAAAQVAANLDLGFTDVRYDGFLPSSAASVSPMFQLQGSRVALTTRGTFLRFESGRRSLQLGVAGSYFFPSLGRLQIELSGNAGASRYADFASFSHVLAGPRLHLTGDRQGVWIGSMIGATSFGTGNRAVTSFATGAWAERLGATWLLNATTTKVGDTSYVDVLGATHYEAGRVTLDGSLGSRNRSQGGGHGVYGEVSGTVAFGSWLSLVLAGGRYPTDPTRGSVSGRYLGLSMRITPLPHRTAAARPARQFGFTGHGSTSVDDPPAATAEMVHCDCIGGILVIYAGNATVVEVSGDFTDWDPVSLGPGDLPGTWRVATRLAPGTYRFNVRLDGKEWFVPAGVTRLQDEFGGEVGVLVVP